MAILKRIEKMMEEDKRKEIIIILFFFTIIVFGILLFCGTLTSGIHLVDDHEFWQFSRDIQREDFKIIDYMISRIQSDFTWRFRPLYYPARIMLTAVFGTNLFAMSVLKGIEIVLACVFIYFIARKLNCTIFYSVITVFMVLVGPQAAVWWKLGPQESTGTWIFALGILCLFKWEETRKIRYNVMALLLIIITSLYKESFIALIPPVMLIYVYFSMKGKQINGRNLWIAIKENLPSELVLGLVLIIEAYVILFMVGINEVEYIGVNPDLGAWFYIKVFLNNFRLYLRVGQYGAFVLALLILFRKKIADILKETKWQFLLACLMVLPQFFLYVKTGLEERYVIPWIYGVAFFFIIVLSQSRYVEGKKRKAYNFLLLLLLLFNFGMTLYEGLY
ncbi:MAG: hypothetical protein ACI4DN_07205, partial [Lachnospiraceae bacterium]